MDVEYFGPPASSRAGTWPPWGGSRDGDGHRGRQLCLRCSELQARGQLGRKGTSSTAPTTPRTSGAGQFRGPAAGGAPPPHGRSGSFRPEFQVAGGCLVDQLAGDVAPGSPGCVPRSTLSTWPPPWTASTGSTTSDGWAPGRTSCARSGQRRRGSRHVGLPERPSASPNAVLVRGDDRLRVHLRPRPRLTGRASFAEEVVAWSGAVTTATGATLTTRRVWPPLCPCHGQLGIGACLGRHRLRRPR